MALRSVSSKGLIVTDKRKELSPRSIVQLCSKGHHIESPKGLAKCPVFVSGKACKGTLKPPKPGLEEEA